MSSMVDKQEIIDMIRLKSPRLELVSFEAGKSEAWRWFKRVRVDGLVLPYAVCNGCFKPVHYTPRDGTGGLRRHACPLTVAMSQAKDAANGNNNTTTNNSNNNYSRKAAASRANSSSAIKKQQQQANAHGGTYSPQASSHSTTNEDDSRSSRHRRSTVPVSLTLWAAEKGLVDLQNAAAAASVLPPGGGLSSIASAFAALQGIVPRSPFLTSLAHQQQQQQQQHQQQQQQQQQQQPLPLTARSNGSPIMADSAMALDLAMKKSTSPERRPVIAQQQQNDDSDEVEMKDRTQKIVDHILKNISQSKCVTTGQDANQNEHNLASAHRFSIVPASRSGRRPRKRSNPDRAIPTRPFDPDIEANLQMLAQVANEPPAVKRERLSPDPIVDHYRNASLLNYHMNGGQLTPTSQHSVPSPDVHDHRGGGSSTSKSGHSSPAQLVPAVIRGPDVPDNVSTFQLKESSQWTKPVETFVQSIHHVLQNSPADVSLADAAASIQLNDLHTCLHSLLHLHQKVHTI